MSNTKYILSKRNPDKCEPDTFYYCSTKELPDGMDGTCWDPDPDRAHTFHSMETTALRLQKLKELGIKDLTVLQRIITYEPTDSEQFTEIVTKNKMRDIIDTLNDDDVDFLVKHANLDLTIVT